MGNKNQSIFSGTCVSAEQDTRRKLLRKYLAELLLALLLPIFATTFSSPRDIAFFLQCPQEVQVLAGQRRGAFWGVFAPQCKLVD